jgi:hypothetical protein
MPGEPFRAVGRDGEYEIKSNGYHPQAGDGYIYKDERYHFWFYVKLKRQAHEEQNQASGYDLVVTDASVKRFSGAEPSIVPKDQVSIEENIRHYFERVDIIGRPITHTNPGPRHVLFTWNLRHDRAD